MASPPENEENGCPEVGRDPRVVAELGRRRNVGVIRAKDDDDVESMLDRLEAADDPGEGGPGVGVDIVIGRTHEVAGGWCIEKGQQEVEDIVRTGG